MEHHPTHTGDDSAGHANTTAAIAAAAAEDIIYQWHGGQGAAAAGQAALSLSYLSCSLSQGDVALNREGGGVETRE